MTVIGVILLAVGLCAASEVPGQMQSRAVETRVQYEIKEGLPKGSKVATIPTKAGFTYRFNESPAEFTMNGTTGEIRTTTVLDREALPTDRFDLVVLSSQPTYPIEVRILVLDVNDNSPEFPEPSIAVSFSESSVAGTRVLLDSAEDRDSGVNGVSDDYRIVAGNAKDKFRLEVTANPSGETSYLHLQTTGDLDREERSSYQLNISARDGGSPPRFGYLLVNVTILDVNDNPPIFDHSDYNVSLNESVPAGTRVLQVMATDNDVGDNSKITYYLSESERKFTVDPETGVISTAELLDCPHQKCIQSGETVGSCPKSCVFTVYARDHGSPRQDGRTYVTVNLVDANDHDPTIRFKYFFPANVDYATVDENAANGSVVAAVSVQDLDEGLNGETHVEIKSGNELNHFSLEYSETFHIVRVNGVLDREHINKYNLTIVATDKGSPPRTDRAFLIIKVNDVNDHEPVFEKTEYSAILSELAPPGSYVAGITATDEDSGVNAQIYYAFVSGNDNQWFEIDTNSGLITTKSPLDREVQGTVELKISARDGGPNPKWAYTHLKVIILDENDEKPSFNQEVINVNLLESKPAQTLVAMLTAEDHDQGTNGTVTYSLHSDVQQRYPGMFTLNSLTGKLTTNTKLDRERESRYEIRVIAKDQGTPPQSSTATVLIKVDDVNDNSPEFYPQQYFVLVNENHPIGTSLLRVTAKDRDEGENAVIRFNVEEGSSGMFQIDENTGVISLKQFLGKSQQALFKLRVSAKDKGGRKAVEDAIVEIIKESQAEELEFDSYGAFAFSIMEDHEKKEPIIGRNVGKVQVSHPQKNHIRYSIVYGDELKTFKIDERTGVITTANRIDRELTPLYSLTVAARSGLSYGKCTVNITILDENDNSPVFSRDNDKITLAENAAVGQEVYLAVARDGDSGANSRITFNLSSNSDNHFRIVENTGVVYLNRPIRGEPGTQLSVEITATDSGSPPLSSRHLVIITIEDVNDHTPVFDHTSYETSLLESTSVNERFFALAATDADLGSNGLVSYKIIEGNNEGKFGVFPDGYVYVKSPLDREDRDYYSLTVRASDHGTPPRSSTVPVVIHVIDENDNKPEFTNSTFKFQIRENEPADSFVGKLTAVDNDIGRNAELTFSFTKSDFAIDPKNGFIKTLHVFDREELIERTGQDFISLEATVTDNGITRLKDKATVNVYIIDVNDNAPEFLRTPYKVQISEGSNIGTQVIRVFTDDADDGLNGDVFYTLSEGNEEGKFTIDEATGQISIAKLLDRETKSRYSLTVVAHDAAISSRLSSTATIVVDVLDENDNAPEFTQTDYKISVLENTPVNTELIQFRATDADLGMNSEVLFSIGTGNRRDTFHVDPTTGSLYLHKQLDYEELNSYILNITASDGGNPRLSTTLLFTVNVEDCNDNPPFFTNTAIVRQIKERIAENTPIVTVTAEDPDSGTNGEITYSILKQEPDDPNHPGKLHFQIDKRTGVIRTRLPIDREIVDTFRLTVVATDQAQPETARLSAEKLVTVIVEDVNDNAPNFVSMTSAVLTPPRRQGQFIMNVQATDLDSSTNGLVTYDLITGNTDLFQLNRNTGAVTLRRDISDPDSRYKIAVKATDEAVQSDRKSTDTYITIICAGGGGPSFEKDSLRGSVYENEGPGSNIVTVRALASGSDEVEYYVTNVTGSGGRQSERLFDIDAKSGVLSTAVPLDREAGQEFYTVTVYAIIVNSASPRASSTQIQVRVLDKNDSPPSFEGMPTEFSVSEELGVGETVAEVKAVDPDTIGQTSYSLVSGGEGKLTVSSSGMIIITEPLDREAKDSYSLRVRATDGVQASHTLIAIHVTDTNDNPPVFLESVYSFDVSEETGRGTKVGSVSAKDSDLGLNGQVSYSVISDWANDIFSLNPQTGVFTLTARLDYEEVQHYIFVVEAEDGGKPALSSTVSVYINVLDVNDNAPLFDPMSYSNEVFENATIGTSVVTVTATDLDSDDNGRVEYNIISGNDDSVFEIDIDNGTIRTRRNLDREAKSLYNLVVMASDQAKLPPHRLSSTVQVSVVVKDVNDMWPEIVPPKEASVVENAAAGTLVLIIKAVDKDEGRNGYIEYRLSGEGASSFTLGAVDGLLRVSQPLDRESKANYTLEVTARDRGEPPKSTKTALFVNVLDMNDNSPVFDPKQYSASVPENASIGASVLQVSATDVDEGMNGRIRYAIVGGDDNRDFSIGEDTGVVRVAKNLNFERKSRYTLRVRAEDCSQESAVRHDTATITVSVSDINDNPPTFLDSPYLAYVMENVVPPLDGYVVTVAAHDADTPPYNGQVRYFLKEEGDRRLFKINSTTGVVSLLKPLDREQQAEYTLTLVAMDTGTPPLIGSGSLKIIVQDVNDHSPEFDRSVYVVSVRENQPAGTRVIQPVATDLDFGLNAKIKYNLVGDNVERFKVDPDTGLIVTTEELDREETKVYYLTFVAKDCSLTDPKATAVNLTIIVSDDNDNSPTFSSATYDINIPNFTKPGQFVFGAKASDLDEGENSKITYSLKGRDAAKFTLDPRTGVIKAASELSFEESKSTEGEYKVKIIGTDGGVEPRVALADLTIKLMPIRNFPTIKTPNTTHFTLPEDIEVGKLITKIMASSPKPGKAGVIQFAIAGSNIGDAIRVDPTSGEVLVAGGGLDYETTPQYEVWIEARDSDNPPLRSVVQLIINITDANDNQPVLELPIYNAMILEEEPPQQEVVTVKATDADSGLNGMVSYKLRNDANGTFSIESDTGEIYTNYKLDREFMSSYQLIVEAVDRGTPQLTGTATVSVTVQDKNDNPPRFTRLFSVNVTENAEIGSFVIRLLSSDLDSGENANATYMFSQNPGKKFAIDPLTGNVTVAGPLDRETQDEYFLYVVAYDGAWTAATPLTVTIQDQNDNAPEFDHSYYSFNFPELQRNVRFVGQVLASDRDKHGPNSVISYSLKHPSDLFTVDPASGELFFKRALRYKYSALDPSPENQYSLTVLATDNGKPPMSSECLVTINVVDANNNAPKFEQREYFSPILQNAKVGQQIVRVMATDEQDYGINAEIEYVIRGGNGSDLFTIDKDTGWISLLKPFDGSEKISTQYILQIRALDHGVPSQHDDVRVTLVITGENKYPPVFTALSYQVNVHENEPIGSTIVTVAAADMDEGPNGMIRYVISNGNTEGHFTVNPLTGAVTILHELDYDTMKEYKLNITAKDLGFAPRTAKAMLTVILTDINDNPPTFNQTAYEAVIPENSPPNTVIYQVKAVDIDSPKNSIIQYSIVGGSGKDYCDIDLKTGTITSKVKFDYEERTKYTLDILAVNPDSPMYGSTKVIVKVSGVNEYYPTFVQPVFHFDVSETAEMGSTVGMIQATDLDSGDDGKVYYLFVGSSNDKGFAINPESGIITVSRRLDRETQNRVVLTVMAKNAGGIRGNDTDEAQVIITIQDGNDPPEFLQQLYETDISEAVPRGTKLISVKAVDKDVRPQNNQFSYSIISGNTGHVFKIDSQNGDIETVLSLDREKTPFYSLVVGAIDIGSPPETGTTMVKVIVTDVNDNGPSFDPPNLTGYVVENELPNTSVMTLSATDPDLPPNGAPFAYTVVGGKSRDFVRIDRNTGVVKTTRIIDRETTPELEIIVEIEDSGHPKMKSRHPVKISVIDQNDSPSTPRTVHIMVFTFNSLFPTGLIADVHPNDADTSGDYHCTLLDNPTVRGLLSIPTGCGLHTSRVAIGQKYSFSVSGNDGKHPDAISTATIEFFTFDNATVENSFTLRINNMSAHSFLTYHYTSFVKLLKSTFEPTDSPYLYSLREHENGLELSIAVKSNKGYRNKVQVLEILSRKEDAIRALIRATSIVISYSPCSNTTCMNGGFCSEAINVYEDTRRTDSQTLIFTSPLVNHEFTCKCPEGFTGQKCERRQDPCSPNPCLAGGTCRRQGFDFQCLCPPMREGRVCESERGDMCSGNPCKNGGSCQESPDGSSFFCLCRPGYRGNQCEAATDSCRPNPCLHGGLCISLKPGYRCSCPESRHGRHCEKSTFGFNELSYMAFSPLDGGTNDLSITFATTKPDSLLIYNFGPQTGGRSDFVALELINGKAVFSYGGTRTAITSVSVTGSDASLADGEWHKITATRNGRLVSLSISSCTDNGDSCTDCRPEDTACYANLVGPAGTLNFNNFPMYIGGLSSADPILERPGQVHSDDFIGCVHSVSINGRALNLTNPMKSKGISSMCPRSGRSMCTGVSSNSIPDSTEQASFFRPSCGSEGKCFDKWHSVSCSCDQNGLISPDCSESLEPVSLSSGGYVEYKISETHRRMQLLDTLYGGSTLWHSRNIDRTRRNSVKTTISPQQPPKHLSIMFRTYKADGTIIFSATNSDFTIIQLLNGQLVYTSQLGSTAYPVNMTVGELMLTDGQWHNITLESQYQGLRLIVDGHKVGDELDAASVHDFLDPYLTEFSVGGARKDAIQGHEFYPHSFIGCLANFTINDEIQPLNGSGSIFSEVIIHGKVEAGCSGPLGIGAAVTTDPLSIGISLILVFFVILFIAILASFVVFRLRRQAKEKSGVMKSNGGGSLRGTGGGVGGLPCDRSGSMQEGAVTSFITENGDVIRGVGHHLVGPELISKKYKDQDAISDHQQRTQRPDIIEREVVSKSPPPRDDHHPPLPLSHHSHDAVMDSDMPEHYDLENSSSIAPSDIDIVYHYKGYREGSRNLRKYKSTPPHLPPGAPVFHKHTVSTPPHHRHSPHFPSRSVLPPPPVSRVDSPSKIQLQHQSTPLARLSPSSELSQQMPRILTLQDISGKPLQSALLAATSSSGGVGKDVLHSNSERSLNSPVMSQLSGQSSASRKTPGVAGGGPGSGVGGTGGSGGEVGLTAEEINRLSSRGRTSSLVSTLDAVSSSSGAPPNGPPLHLHRSSDQHDGDGSTTTTTTDESGNDSFTCSEIEYDNASVSNEKTRKPGYDIDSSFRGSLSTLVASDDDSHPPYRPRNGSPGVIGLDYLLNWGPNFESIVGVFKDIAELPETNGRVSSSLRLPNGSAKPSEEYV
ncbi:cadherin-related tumor suppressor [Cimex lectularius]|uniref:Protocadherin-16 n=1 Tax=Cimex lectularius TaxID=79782 RepID=A0A8I6TFC6_CIMLE|nr:cadherin-related tumor suppressor [Cimex lectularius]